MNSTKTGVMTFKSPFHRFSGVDLAFKKLPKGAFGLLRMLADQIAEIEIQRERVRNNLSLLSDSDLGIGVEFDQAYYTVLADVHFYIIAWTNVHKTLQRLASLMRDPRLGWILKRRSKWFAQVRQARNNFEHIDERVSKLEDRTLGLIQLAGIKRISIIVCGARVDVSEASFKRIDTLTTDLEKWVSRMPERFGT